MARARLRMSGVGRDASGDAGDTFTWYPALDFNDVPWHVSSGAWGSQYTMPEAAAPVTTNTENPTTLAQFQAALVSGNRININAGVTITCTAGSLQATGETLSDIDIVIASTGALLNFRLGSEGDLWQLVQRYRDAARVGCGR